MIPCFHIREARTALHCTTHRNETIIQTRHGKMDEVLFKSWLLLRQNIVR